MIKYLDHISINSEIRFGKPCIKGTRIVVVDILQWLSSGMTIMEYSRFYSLNHLEYSLASR